MKPFALWLAEKIVGTLVSVVVLALVAIVGWGIATAEQDENVFYAIVTVPDEFSGYLEGISADLRALRLKADELKP